MSANNEVNVHSSQSSSTSSSLSEIPSSQTVSNPISEFTPRLRNLSVVINRLVTDNPFRFRHIITSPVKRRLRKHAREIRKTKNEINQLSNYVKSLRKLTTRTITEMVRKRKLISRRKTLVRSIISLAREDKDEVIPIIDNLNALPRNRSNRFDLKIADEELISYLESNFYIDGNTSNSQELEPGSSSPSLSDINDNLQ